jgi:hypothetical protein
MHHRIFPAYTFTAPKQCRPTPRFLRSRFDDVHAPPYGRERIAHVTTDVTLLVLAAGMSSRYGGASKQTDGMGPNGETILDYSIHDAKAAGFTRVVFVIRVEGEAEFRERVVRHLEPHIPVSLAFQDLDDLPGDRVRPADRAKPWGTGHAVLAARKHIDGPFCVINADDFYGRDSFGKMADFLRSAPMHGNPARFAMVGFALRNTLSHHGTVSRGLCSLDAADQLTGVEELTDIHAVGNGGAELREADGAVTRSFTGEETVSMNMWGFSPQMIGWLERGFASFFDARSHEPKSEYYIPLAVDELIRADKATVKVLRSSDRWFGVTYQEDRARVEEAMLELTNNGAYPSPLW